MGATIRYTETQFRLAVQTSYTLQQVLRKLGLRMGGGSSSNLKRKIRRLGLDISHFTRKGIGGRRVRVSFICKGCDKLVRLGFGEVPRVYCSGACLKQYRPASIKASFNLPGRREKLSKALKQSWADPQVRAKHFAIRNTPEVLERRRVAARLASQSPTLRAQRSKNAKAKWESDSGFREKFLKAARTNRRARAGVCPRKPHVPYDSKTNGTVMLRSLWERDFALFLDRRNKSWKYEPLRVVTPHGPYTPDFLVGSLSAGYFVELHRVITAEVGDLKLVKLEAARKLLPLPLVLISENGIALIRRQLRQ